MVKNFSKKAREAIKLIEKTNRNVFVTGKAGTGKSTLLEYVKNESKKQTVILAPTGIAAINVNGETIHSFFSLKPGFEKDEARKMRIDEEKAKKYREIKTIAIDEISMVRADLLDAVDIFLRRVRKNNKSFGGVQMIFFGDLFQLSPVVTSSDREKFFSEYCSPYFFDADVFHGQSSIFEGPFKMKIIELDKMYRQKNSNFVEILNAVRDNTVTPDHLSKLNKRYFPNFVPDKKDKYIHLVTTNAVADYINFNKLEELNREKIVFCAEQSGDVPKNLYPNNLEIVLSIGAQVMFIYNDPERRWVNGTIGKVVDIVEAYNEETEESRYVVMVKKDDGEIVEVNKYNWEISKYVYHRGNFEREIMGVYKQLPIKLAWAITIHKSQGKTFDRVVIDLGRGSFAHGQTYVALSRCRTLEGMVLKKRIYKSSIIMDERVKNFK